MRERVCTYAYVWLNPFVCVCVFGYFFFHFMSTWREIGRWRLKNWHNRIGKKNLIRTHFAMVNVVEKCVCTFQTWQPPPSQQQQQQQHHTHNNWLLRRDLGLLITVHCTDMAVHFELRTITISLCEINKLQQQFMRKFMCTSHTIVYIARCI